MSFTSVVLEIETERKRQDYQWGGAGHDDHHAREEWLTFLRRQTEKAARALRDGDLAAHRHYLRNIAALAIADLEAMDRYADAVVRGDNQHDHEVDLRGDRDRARETGPGPRRPGQ